MRIPRLRCPVALVVLLAASCADPVSDPSTVLPTPLLVRDVTVIDAAQGLRSGLDVLVTGDRITAVGANLTAPAGTTAIDGSNKYLIPGLWDAHVHLTFTPEISPAMFALFIANGITSVRDTGGQLAEVMPRRERARSGTAPAPRVFIAGPLIDGVPRVYDGSDPFRPDISIGVATPREAVEAVDALARAGVDLIKAYELLSPDVFDALIERAVEYGLPVTGHAPLSMDASRASAMGMRSMEHMRNLELACSSEADELLRQRRATIAARRHEPGATVRSAIHSAQRPRAVATHDEPRCPALVRTLAGNATWQVPTLTMVTPRVTRLYARPEWRQTYRYVPEPVRSQWNQASEAMASDEPDEPTRAHAEWARGMVARLAAGGVPIMAGTDTPIFFLTPGFSLHQELVLLVEAGLTPAQALEAATLAPARYFDLDEELGTIGPSKLADLVLLDANPLEDIANTQRVGAVISNGELYDRAALDELLEQLAR